MHVDWKCFFFAFLRCDFDHIFAQIVSMKVKKCNYSYFAASRLETVLHGGRGPQERWGNPLWWGNPPVHIISHFSLIMFTHMLPHLSGVPYLYVKRPLLKWKRSHFRLTWVAQKRLCFSSFIRILHNLRSSRYTGKVHFSRMTFRVNSQSFPILLRLAVLRTCFSNY